MSITILSKKSITFPKLRWSAEKGETKKLPEDKEAQKVILASPYIHILVETKDTQNSEKVNETGSKSEERRKKIQSGKEYEKESVAQSERKKEDK